MKSEEWKPDPTATEKALEELMEASVAQYDALAGALAMPHNPDNHLAAMNSFNEVKRAHRRYVNSVNATAIGYKGEWRVPTTEAEAYRETRLSRDRDRKAAIAARYK